ncbi:Myb-like_DNA-binding domain-containing protein [Hexamita inflata]|uniref:Myb-like DNA-binding domain-containing protein n=1 Tax=Hexamita inflata TaxID=28002 RepID=A0AA86U489_9EUKA|nr:Myb-like DNA-binding domain-containing protein [Hexamita inflata]
MQNAKSYNHWSQAETRYLMASVKNYKNRKIDWIQIQRNLPDRTVLQCKSFFHNHTQKYELAYLLSRYDATQVAYKLLEFCTKKETIRDVKDPKQRQYMNNLEADFLMNIYHLERESSFFPFNFPLLGLLQEMILIYNRLRADYPSSRKPASTRQQQIDSLASFMKSIDCDSLLKKLQMLLAKLK